MRWQSPMKYSIMNEGTIREMIADNMRDHKPLSPFLYRFTSYTICENNEVKELLIEAEGSILAFYRCRNEYRDVSRRFLQL